MTTLLAVSQLRAGYGAIDILQGVDIRVDAAESVVIIGPNGAGKSTLLKALFGLVDVHAGTVVLDGVDITQVAPERLVRLGIGYVPQEGNVFPTLTVQENLEMGAFTVPGRHEALVAAQMALFPALTACRHRIAGELSGGQRQMVALARALMTRPKLLLLDEPTVGLSPMVMEEIFVHIRAINRSGVGVLMVEQNARRALALADRGYVLAAGQNRFEGTGADLLASREIAHGFLGGPDEDAPAEGMRQG